MRLSDPAGAAVGPFVDLNRKDQPHVESLKSPSVEGLDRRLAGGRRGLLVAASAQASTLPTLTLTLTKSSITVGGTTQSGGVNVVTTATGVKEATAILFLLKPGVTFDEVEAPFTRVTAIPM